MARRTDDAGRGVARLRGPATARCHESRHACLRGAAGTALGDLRQMSGNLLTRQRLRAEHLSALLPEAVRNFLARQATRLDNAAELIAGRSPERILRLGFAVVRTGGKAVVSARGVRKGDALEIEVADGTIHGTAQKTFLTS